jgi:hypothetical protein
MQLDEKLDYQKIFAPHIREAKLNGDNLNGLCPFHDDKNASFGVNIKTGMYKCFGCGAEGNATTFVAQISGVDTKEAHRRLLEEAGMLEEPKEKKPAPKLTVSMYAAEKRLDEELLKSIGLSNEKIGIAIPYMDECGQIVKKRIRYHKDHTMRFSWGKNGSLILYGLWMLEDVKASGSVILVEGESDCHTLWQRGVKNAMGVPGATTFNDAWAKHLEGMSIYIHDEGDAGGAEFVQRTCKVLSRCGHSGEVFRISCRGAEVKDPSELHLKYPDKFENLWKSVMDSAEKLDLKVMAADLKELVPGAPVKLKCPYGWEIDEHSIRMFNEKKGSYVTICKTPVMITRRMKSLDTGEEKVELAFLRDGEWNVFNEARSVVFQSRDLVRFLGDLESENINVLDVAKSVSQLGWYGRKFLPGLKGDIVIDVDRNSRKWVDAYSEKGDLERWICDMAPYRKNDIFRFLLASSFAAPLLKILSHRVFFVHNWGDSRSGKTAALKGALSVWGDPEELMTSFNATRVGLERLAGFFNDLPLGIDERQVVGNKQDYLETLVYMLSLGTSKIRGSKHGGLQNSQAWRTIVLTTGEEPLTTSSSQAGVFTRALEIYGAPFGSETDARKMHDISVTNYGSAGPAFIRRLIELKADELQSEHKALQDKLSERYPNKIGSHVSSTAVVALADKYVSKWLFSEEVDPIVLGSKILDKMEDQHETDIITRAKEFIEEWIVMNFQRFDIDEARNELYGVHEHNNGKFHYHIFPSILERALEDKGFSFKKTMHGLLERGFIYPGVRSDGKEHFSRSKRIDGKVVRVVTFYPTMEDRPDEIPPF